MPERRLSEKEVGRLMSRIAARQTPDGATKDGVPLSQLRQAAAELGIDDAVFDAALRDVDSESQGGFSIWGGPSSVDLDRTFEGSVDESKWSDVVAEIRSAAGVAGSPVVSGNSLEWQGGEPGYHVSVASSDGRTRVKVLANASEYGLVMFLTGMALLVPISLVLAIRMHIGTPLGTVAFFFLSFLSFLLVRLAFNSFCRGVDAKARKVMSRLETHLTSRTKGVQAAPLFTGSEALSEDQPRVVTDG
jgi:hypothetical protein